MNPLPKSQRYISFDADGGLVFKSRRLKEERGAYMVHCDAEISYRKRCGNTFQVRSGHTLIVPAEDFPKFCENPPEWFRGEY